MKKGSIFKCKNCGRCCGPFPMERKFIEQHKDKIQTTPIQVHDIGGGLVVLETISLKCVFLSEKFRCEIYADRPKICRMFGTGLTNEPLLKCPLEV